jgi:hypothetical protein
MLEQNVYTVGTATTTVVAPTVDSARYVLKNLQPSPFMGDLARKGHIYSVGRYFPIANNGTAIFSFTTGDSGAQFENWEFNSSTSSVLASLIEGATITTTGSAIPAYNLNRNDSDAHAAVLIGASALTGGTTVISQYVGASNQAVGGSSQNIPVTLEPNTQYGFKFVDVGGNGTNVHIQLDWAEQYNGYNDIWLGTKDDSYILHGGEEISMYLRPYEIINATAGSEGCRLAVMRQD